MIGRWRVAARLARREVRRHWVRSGLVVLIVALPVMAAQGAALFYRSVELQVYGELPSAGVIWMPEMAGADSMTGFDPRLGPPPAVEGATRVETGFSIWDYTHAAGDGLGPDDLARLHVVGFVPGASEVDLVEGREPATRYEVVASRDLAAQADLEVGDRVTAIASAVELEVVGLSGSNTEDAPTAWAGPVADGDDWVPAALVRIRDSGSPFVTAEMFDLYWLPPAMAPPDAIDTYEGGVFADDRSVSVEQAVGGAATAAIAIGFVATICSAAFAIGARRQLRALGTLSAAGAAPADLARALLLQGTVLGLAGGALGTALAVVGRIVVVEAIADGGSWVIPWAPDLLLGVVVLGVVAGTLAALVPALTASRIPTLSALSGRRPTRRRPLRSPYVGVVLVVVGLGLLSWASASRVDDASAAARVAAAIVAVLATMAGGIALSPAVVAGLARLSARAPGTVRLAGRSLARDGMRSAAVVASAGVAIAVPVVVLVMGARDLGQDVLSPAQRAELDRLEAVEEAFATVELSGPAEAREPVVAQIVQILGPDSVVARPVDLGTSSGTGPGVAVDPAELARLTPDDDVADDLAAGTVVRLVSRVDPFVAPNTHVAPEAVQAQDRDVRIVGIDDVSDLTALLLARAPAGMVSDEVAEGVATSGAETVLRAEPLTEDEDRRLVALGPPGGDLAPTVAALTEDLGAPAGPGAVEVFTDRSDEHDPWWDVPGEVVALAVALLVALAVIGVASALAAADGRPDEVVVAAVGAPPAVVRRRRVLEAAGTATGAVVLGGGLGTTAALVTIHTPLVADARAPDPFRLPIVDLLGVGVGTVALVAGATWLALTVTALVRGRRDVVLVDG